MVLFPAKKNAPEFITSKNAFFYHVLSRFFFSLSFFFFLFFPQIFIFLVFLQQPYNPPGPHYFAKYIFLKALLNPIILMRFPSASTPSRRWRPTKHISQLHINCLFKNINAYMATRWEKY